ncbi:MAG: hypothetical protein ACE5GK_10955 [Nitrospiria bacterium]
MPKWFGGSTLNPNETVKLKNQWMEQFARLRRGYIRVQALKAKSETEQLTAEDFDTLIVFFQNCYHLRDWLESTRLELRSDIDALFENNFEMRGCRDICHGFKHKDLKGPSLDADFNLYIEYDYFAEADQKSNPKVYRIAFADGNDIRKFTVFHFAERCLELWMNFLQDHGLVRVADSTI